MIVKVLADAEQIVRSDGVKISALFECSGVHMGYAVFPPGMRAPAAIHKEDEYAYVIEGSIKAEAGGVICEARAGSVTFIPAGEEHISFNDTTDECRVVWLLVPKNRQPLK